MIEVYSRRWEKWQYQKEKHQQLVKINVVPILN